MYAVFFRDYRHRLIPSDPVLWVLFSGAVGTNSEFRALFSGAVGTNSLGAVLRGKWHKLLHSGTVLWALFSGAIS